MMSLGSDVHFESDFRLEFEAVMLLVFSVSSSTLGCPCYLLSVDPWYENPEAGV